MKLKRKSKTLPKSKKFIYDDFTIEMSFDEIPDKKTKRKIITTLKKDKYFKKVKIKSTKDNNITLFIKYGNSIFFPSSTSSVRDSIMDYADDYQFNFTVMSKCGNHCISYEWEEKKYCVYYVEKIIQKRVAYVYANSERNAEEKLYNGDFIDDEWVDDLDCEIIRINDTERC